MAFSGRSASRAALVSAFLSVVALVTFSVAGPATAQNRDRVLLQDGCGELVHKPRHIKFNCRNRRGHRRHRSRRNRGKVQLKRLNWGNGFDNPPARGRGRAVIKRRGADQSFRVRVRARRIIRCREDGDRVDAYSRIRIRSRQGSIDGFGRSKNKRVGCAN